MRSVRRLSHPTADSWLAPGFQMIQPRLKACAIERARPFVPEPLFGPLICQSPLFRLAPQLTRGIFLRHLSRYHHFRPHPPRSFVGIRRTRTTRPALPSDLHALLDFQGGDFLAGGLQCGIVV